MKRTTGAAIASLVVLGLSVAAVPRAAAQDYSDMTGERRKIESPEWFALELRVGPYTPEIGAAFDETFAGDDGWMLALELDVLIYRIPYVGPIGIGAGIGWAGYSAGAFAAADGTRVQEETTLDLVPLNIMAVLRIDALARYLDVPFVFFGKIGLDYVLWDTNTGESDDASGASPGLRWGVGLALELDFLEPDSARTLDEEWGINHAFIFGELYGSNAGGDSLPVGDTTIAVGLGFTF